MPCLDENTLADYFDGAASDEQRARVDAELDSCESCRELACAWAKAAITQASFHSASENDEVESSADPHSVEMRQDTRLRLGERLDKYETREYLGGGGMGLVFRARDTKLDRDVALKVVSLRLRAVASDEPIAEAKAMARVRHPNTVTVFEVGSDGGRGFIAMELIEGCNLTTWLRGGKRSEHQVVEVFLQASRGLAAVHEAGLVHGDVKPANILVDSHGRASVTDFGLAQAARGPGEIRAQGGTPKHMAPEVLATGYQSKLSDQYSFFSSLKNALAVTNGGTPERIQRMIRRGMAHNASDRFDDMFQVTTELDKYLRGARRRRGVAWGIAAVFLASIPTYFVAAAIFGESAIECHASSEFESDFADVTTRLHERAATGSAEAPALGQLQEFHDRWQQQYTDSCRSTFQLHTQSSALHDQRTVCLGRLHGQLLQLGRVVGLDESRPASLAATLGDPRSCSAGELVYKVASPLDSAARLAEDKLYGEFLEAEVLVRRGDKKAGLALLDDVIARARKRGFAGILAMGFLARAMVRSAKDQLKRAEADVKESLSWATRARMHRVRVRAWLLLATWAPNRETAEKYLLAAELVLEDLPSDSGLIRGYLALGQADFLHKYGTPKAHLDEATRALTLLEENGAVPDLIASARLSLGSAYNANGHADKARVQFRNVVDVATKNRLGHNYIFAAYFYLGRLADAHWQREQAEKYYRLGLDVVDRNIDRTWTMVLLTALGASVSNQGRFDDALSLYKDAGALSSGFAANEINRWYGLARAYLYTGQYRQTLATVARLESMALGTGFSGELLAALFQLKVHAYILLKDISAARKLAAFTRASHGDLPAIKQALFAAKTAFAQHEERWHEVLKLYADKSSADFDSPETAVDYIDWAFAAVAAGKVVDAARLQRAANFFRRGDRTDVFDKEAIAKSEFIRARMLWRQGRRADARDLASKALAKCHPKLDFMKEVRSWLANPA